ncbi:hypothetical protein AB1Y20_021925 [Prymnesium parvum]|uniref:Uncharacterized protein n=1 Tax=Prymnesium parvum TaxID=97485 RepID=A0AB34JEG4_PRYPA
MALRREAYSKEKASALQARINNIAPPTRDRTPEEWAALNAEARRQAQVRERKYLEGFWCSHSWRPEDVAASLDAAGMLEKLFDTKPGFNIYFDRVQQLMTKLEKEHFGEEFGLVQTQKI